jgi:hypothetical protein
VAKALSWRRQGGTQVPTLKVGRAPTTVRAYELTDVLTTEELAVWLRKSPRTVQRLGLPQVLHGRYLLADVVQALKARRRLE